MLARSADEPCYCSGTEVPTFLNCLFYQFAAYDLQIS